jgi:hypothetical protein
VDHAFDWTDEEWALLEPLMPKSRKSARVDDGKGPQLKIGLGNAIGQGDDHQQWCG